MNSRRQSPRTSTPLAQGSATTATTATATATTAVESNSAKRRSGGVRSTLRAATTTTTIATTTTPTPPAKAQSVLNFQPSSTKSATARVKVDQTTPTAAVSGSKSRIGLTRLSHVPETRSSSSTRFRNSGGGGGSGGSGGSGDVIEVIDLDDVISDVPLPRQDSIQSSDGCDDMGDISQNQYGASSYNDDSQCSASSQSMSSLSAMSTRWKFTPASQPDSPPRAIFDDAPYSLTNLSIAPYSASAAATITTATAAAAENIDTVAGDTMWADLYPPKSKDILAVHPQKVQQVRSWLVDALANDPPQHIQQQQQQQQYQYQTHSARYGQFRPPFQKYQQVQQQRGLLVLTGPSGCGKTATVRMLSNELKFEIVEWINPARSTVSAATSARLNVSDVIEENDRFESETWVQGRAAQFSEFLRQAVRFPSLTLTGTMAATSSERRNPRTVILIEDLPSVATPHAKQAFQDAISNYITLPRHQTFPLVLIVTDTFSRTPIDDEQLGTGGSYSSNGNFNGNGAAVENVRGLLPSSLIDSAMCKRISFNPIAQTYLVKGLKLFVEQIRTDTSEVGQIHAKGNYRWPSNDQISEIALVSNGDIRSALNNLQLIVTTGMRYTVDEMRQREINNNANSLSTIKGGRKRTRKQAELSSPSPINDRRQSLTQAQRKAMFGDDIPKWSQSAIDTREPIFDLFHSIGKILYNKRRSISSDDGTDRGGFNSDPDHILEHSAVDHDLLLLYSHQNYPLFCGPDNAREPSQSLNGVAGFERNIVAASDWLSQSDVMLSHSGAGGIRGGRRNNAMPGGSSLNGIGAGCSAMVAMRGLMLCLPVNIVDEKGTTVQSARYEQASAASRQHSGPGSNAMQLFKPQYFEATRQRNENRRDLTSLVSTLTLSSGQDPSARVLSMSGHIPIARQHPDLQMDRNLAESGCRYSSSDILDVLPAMQQLRAAPSHLAQHSTFALEKLTKFNRGVVIRVDALDISDLDKEALQESMDIETSVPVPTATPAEETDGEPPTGGDHSEMGDIGAPGAWVAADDMEDIEEFED